MKEGVVGKSVEDVGGEFVREIGERLGFEGVQNVRHDEVEELLKR